jgi:hypothetical protein
MRPDKSRRLSSVAILILIVASCCDEQAGVSTGTPLHCTGFSHNCFVLFPEHQFILCHILDLQRYFTDAMNDFLKEYLKNGVRPGVFPAQLG